MAKTMQQWTLKLIHISYNFNQQARRGANPALNLSEGPKLVSTILPASIELIYSGIGLNCLEKVGVCKCLFRRYMNLDLVTLKLSLTEFQSSDIQNTFSKFEKLGNFEDEMLRIGLSQISGGGRPWRCKRFFWHFVLIYQLKE